MIIVLIGLPGTGKGTQSKYIEQEFSYSSLSTGNMLREMAKEPGLIGDFLRNLPNGSFAPDDIVIKAVKENLQKPAFQHGVVLDGFPRTLAQAQEMIQQGLVPDLVINFEMNSKELEQRITGRWIHTESGRSYHTIFNPPKRPGLDDVTGESLVQRKDDTLEVLKKRIDDHHYLSLPALDWLEKSGTTKVVHVDASKPIGVVWNEIQTCIRNIDPAYSNDLDDIPF